MSLIGFIEMHYAHEDVKDADYDEDMKLPFKSHNLGFGISSLSFVPGDHKDFIFKLPDTGQEFSFFYKDAFLPSTLLSSIWQPPKAC